MGDTVVIRVRGVGSAVDVQALCSELLALLPETEPGTGPKNRVHAGAGYRMVMCDVEAVTSPDAATIDALARLHLTARRAGCRMVLIHAGQELRLLAGLFGLADVLAARPAVTPRGGREGRRG